ncbi:hypothetical protein CPB86DRAFT_756905 [Serendipita vermifera]|nr:hypothetical protein CPB86DRAFT_756905 [Serendipita vermifera]
MSSAVADEKARLRHNAGNGTDETQEKSVAPSPSNLERGATNDELLNTGKDETEPPLTRTRRFKEFTHRIQGKHVDLIPTFMEGMKATVRASWLNLALIFVVMSWVSHFIHWDPRATFILSFLALIPLEKLLQFCSHQSMLYLGHTVGDLVNVTLMNAIEAILAILLLKKPNELRLLQGTIVGVTLLQLTLVPGVMFLAGGSRLVHQELHQTQNQLNQSMLTMGVMCLVIPAAFYAGLSRLTTGEGESFFTTEGVVTAEMRNIILQFSRGMAIIMLCVYIASRIYAINPPGEDNALDLYAAGGHDAFRHEEEKLAKEQPKLSPLFCFGLLVVLVVIIGFTAEWLVESIEFVRERGGITEEWFGMVLLPLISFSGDGIVTFSYLFRRTFFHHGVDPHVLADARPIDLSIQFTLFWTPLLVIIGWGIGRPLPLLFDIFEVVVLVAACFVVNYITADAKTNWAEGFTMCALYVMIALMAWFYPESFSRAFFGVGTADSVLPSSGESHGGGGGGGETTTNHH